jgi:hypothetical protein
MRDMRQFNNMIGEYWKEAICKELPPPAEAKVVTGIPRNDSFLHHMIVEHGVEIILTESVRQDTYAPSWKMTDYKIVDEKKFSWFLLRWS